MIFKKILLDYTLFYTILQDFINIYIYENEAEWSKFSIPLPLDHFLKPMYWPMFEKLYKVHYLYSQLLVLFFWKNFLFNKLNNPHYMRRSREGGRAAPSRAAKLRVVVVNPMILHYFTLFY